MTMAANPTAEQLGLPRRGTLADYFAVGAAALERCEYRDGTIVCLPGGTEPHALVTMNFGRAMGNRLGGGPCRVYSPDLRIGVPRQTHYMYPDVPVVCGPSEFDPRDPTGQTVVNPRLVVEVLSPTTEAYDRGAKFRRYLEIDSFQEYVLVSQDVPWVESYYRQADGGWLFTFAKGLEGNIRLRSLEVEVPLAEVYAGVTFPPLPADEAEVPDPPPVP